MFFSTKTLLRPTRLSHYRETGQKGGILVYFGPQSGVQERSETVDLEQRSCGNVWTQPKCDTKNAARNGNCDALVSELYNDGDVAIPGSPRQICYQGDSDKNAFCCVSWRNAVKNLRKRDLAPYASAILNQCTQNGISGKTTNIPLRSVCTSVCLSNRGTHC
ncbi:uncharacterized protein N7473_009767 [Penicillium subrubescens]|uniref:uncharacterized protein n=1 Tax=Penicillium subrubescens TaxID=1316194 RepID=UPI002544F8C1|nr:uncharacterized protein N7473_009767 [Penicillium subrubescens]KAJ5882881.1 hypothetical protein N7473_009767 [Penicillium subrubescens]